VRFLETVCVKRGHPLRLAWHQRRFDQTRQAHFDNPSPVSLRDLLQPPADAPLLRARVLYDADTATVTYHPYIPRPLRRLRLVHADPDYRYKYADRSALDALFAKRAEADDVLIVRDGLLTDTTVANIAFYRDGRWFTPQTPLLPGTVRARLLASGFLTPMDITPKALPRFRYFALMNAMIGFLVVKHGKIG